MTHNRDNYHVLYPYAVAVDDRQLPGPYVSAQLVKVRLALTNLNYGNCRYRFQLKNLRLLTILQRP
jgi:hypothetical protein